MWHMRISVLSLLLGGCALYPTTRTFYEGNPADGVATNRMSCGYIHTRDSLRRVVNGVELDLAPGDESMHEPFSDALTLSVSLTWRDTQAALDISKIELLTDTDGRRFDPKIVNLQTRPIRQAGGTFQWQTARVVYPEPSGLANKVTFVFREDALTVNGQPLAVQPFHFSRVTKKDWYYGSINC